MGRRARKFRRFGPAVAVAGIAACFAVPMLGRARSSVAVASARALATHQASATEIRTIRAQSNLVVVDVVASDRQGNPVRGLKPSDFTLLENGEPQLVKHFEEHSALPAGEAQTAPAEKLPPGLFTNKMAAPANGPVNVLLLDYLNTPLNSQPYARRQLLEFLDNAAPGTRIAIFSLNTQLSMLQGFTSDLSVLKAALISKKGAPGVSDILLDPVHGGPMKDTTLEALQVWANQPQTDDLYRMEALQTSFTQDIRAKYTLNGFDQLARYLVGIPGRKNVVWFSGGFPLNVEPNVYEGDPNDSVVRNDEEVRKTDNLLTRAQIAVYPVDARGVQGDPALDFGLGITEMRMAAALGMAGDKDVGVPQVDAAKAIDESSVATMLMDKAQEQETMFAMAEDTGGEAFVNTNGLAQVVAKAVEHGSNYYTLTYSPTNEKWDSRFRSIKIKVAQPGVKLVYRNGYYAVDPNDSNRLNAQGAATALAETNTMSAAMVHGSPNDSEILFKVRIRPAAAPPGKTVPTNNQTNPKLKVEGPYRQYGVDLVPDARAVSCPAEADGNRRCALEMWTFVYNREGERVVTASNRVRSVLTPADYAKLLTGGLAFHQQISVPVKGEYSIRTAIHDLVSDRVGAVEVPVDAVVRLDPLQQVAAASTPVSSPSQH